MGNLFIVDGTSSIWKSELIKYVTDNPLTTALIKKRSTRGGRRNEDPDLTDIIHISAQERARQTDTLAWYRYDDQWYGYSPEEMRTTLKKIRNVFIVIRNLDHVRQCQIEFQNHNVITVFVYTDMTMVEGRYRNDEGLLHSAKKAAHDYMYHPEVYDHVMIDGSPDANFAHQLDMLIAGQIPTRSSDVAGLKIIASSRARKVCEWGFSLFLMLLGLIATYFFLQSGEHDFERLSFIELLIIGLIVVLLLFWVALFSKQPTSETRLGRPSSEDD